MQTNDYSNLSVREAQLVAAARMGKTDELVEYLYACMLPGRAKHLTDGYNAQYGARLEVEDVRQVGAEWIVRSLEKALTQEKPVSWLLCIAQRHMVMFCAEQRSAVRVPYSSQWQFGYQPPAVVSLNAPVAGYDDVTLLDLLAS